MPSTVSLMNRALRLIGGQAIAAGDEEGLEAHIASAAFDDIRDTVLADFAWGFATRWASLALLDVQPAFGARYAYRLPTDALRVVDVRNSSDMAQAPAHFWLAGRDVYTDASPCLMRYVARIEQSADWPPHFCEAFVIRLAAELAPVTGPDSSSTPLKLRQLYLQALDTARLTDSAQAMAVPIDPEATNTFLQARN